MISRHRRTVRSLAARQRRACEVRSLDTTLAPASPRPLVLVAVRSKPGRLRLHILQLARPMELARCG